MGNKKKQATSEVEDLIMSGTSLATLVKQGVDMPDTLSFAAAYTALGIGRSSAYQAAKNDDFPCVIIKVGKVFRVPTAELMSVLGLAKQAVPEYELP